MNRVLEYWRTRSLREKQFLAFGGALILAAILGLYVIAPLNKERARIRAALPALRQEAAALESAALEVNRLKPRVSAPITISDMQMTLRESATSMQIDSSNLVINQSGAGRARITLNGVSFNRFANWIDALQRIHKLRVNAALIRALPESGMVAIEAEVIAPAAS